MLTDDNLIVKDYCFIVEIFDKFSFSGILRECLTLSGPAFSVIRQARGGGLEARMPRTQG